MGNSTNTHQPSAISHQPIIQHFYYVTDALNSVTKILNSSGEVVAQTAYDSFGNLALDEGFISNPYNFTGRQYDIETGLYYYRARYYDPQIGRFIQEDPVYDDTNLYTYTNNNPTNKTDPMGLIPLDTIFDVGMTLYDTGKAIYKSTKGDNSGWVDVGLDLLATALPYVPAGTQKLGKVTKEVGGKAAKEIVEETAKKANKADDAVDAIKDSFKVTNPAEKEGANLGEKAVEKTTKTDAQATKNETTVLGKYPDYIKLADELGAKRFNVPTEVWNKMSKAEQWAANQKFLDELIQRGDDIILSNPVKNINDVSGSFRKELDYLIKQGFRLSNDGSRLIR